MMRVHILLKNGAERVVPATSVQQYNDDNGEIARICTPWGSWRAIINVGKKDRILRDHRPGLELFELEPRA